jgi:hypothetical protein
LPPDGATSRISLAPGYALILTLWTHDLAFSPQFTTGGLTRQNPGPLRLTIAYRHPPFGKEERVAVLRVRAWPLVVVCVVAGAGVVWSWRVTSRHMREVNNDLSGHDT